MFIIFDIGGILAALGLIVVFVWLFISLGISDACVAITTFIEDYADIIGIVCITILFLVIVAFFLCKKEASVEKRTVMTIGYALAASQALFGAVYGLYALALSLINEDVFISFFFLIIDVVIYAVVTVINIVLTGGLSMIMAFEDDSDLYIGVTYLLGIIGWIFQTTFW